MSATMIKMVKLTNLQKWNGSAWVALYAKALEVAIITEVTVYENATGVSSASPLPITIDWSNFISNGVPNQTIFGSDANLIVTTVKSIKIRYKIETTSSEIMNPTLTSPDYFYQIIKLSFPTTDAVTGISIYPTGTYNASIKVKVPALVLAALASGQNVAGVHAYLADTANWRIDYLAPGASAVSNLTPATCTLVVNSTVHCTAR